MVKRIVLVLLSLITTACYYRRDYEEQDARALQNQPIAGKALKSYYPYSTPPGVILADGSVETKQKLVSRDCTIYVRYDPRDFIIQGWRAEGKECVSTLR